MADSAQSRDTALPIHFFTIVLNGEPFIRYHIDVFRTLDCDWHWHVVEGVASLVHDTAWSTVTGGHISPEIHRHGRSSDGTSEYLDALVQQESQARTALLRERLAAALDVRSVLTPDQIQKAATIRAGVKDLRAQMRQLFGKQGAD